MKHIPKKKKVTKKRLVIVGQNKSLKVQTILSPKTVNNQQLHEKYPTKNMPLKRHLKPPKAIPSSRISFARTSASWNTRHQLDSNRIRDLVSQKYTYPQTYTQHKIGNGPSRQYVNASSHTVNRTQKCHVNKMISLTQPVSRENLLVPITRNSSRIDQKTQMLYSNTIDPIFNQYTVKPRTPSHSNRKHDILLLPPKAPKNVRESLMQLLSVDRF